MANVMNWYYSDGGRSRYFKAKFVRDCVTRAIANATGKDYKEIYDEINELAKSERKGKKKKGISNARNGVYKTTERKYLKSLGWVYKPVNSIGQVIKFHLTENDLKALGLESGCYILHIARHLTVVKDGVIYDTFNPTFDYNTGESYEPMLYGYYYRAV